MPGPKPRRRTWPRQHYRPPGSKNCSKAAVCGFVYVYKRRGPGNPITTTIDEVTCLTCLRMIVAKRET